MQHFVSRNQKLFDKQSTRFKAVNWFPIFSTNVPINSGTFMRVSGKSKGCEIGLRWSAWEATINNWEKEGAETTSHLLYLEFFSTSSTPFPSLLHPLFSAQGSPAQTYTRGNASRFTWTILLSYHLIKSCKVTSFNGRECFFFHLSLNSRFKIAQN